MNISRRSINIICLVVVNIAADQISKFWIRANITKHSTSEIVGNYFTLHNVENTGAFLGMGSELNPTLKIILLNILPVIVLTIVIRYIIKNKTLDWLSLTGFSFIIGGGISNIYDRIVYKSVTDFWHIDLGSVFKTGIFNMADVSVTIGIIMIVFASFLFKRKANILNT